MRGISILNRNRLTEIDLALILALPVNHRIHPDFLRKSFIIVILQRVTNEADKRACRIARIKIVDEEPQFFTGLSTSLFEARRKLVPIMFLTQKLRVAY